MSLRYGVEPRCSCGDSECDALDGLRQPPIGYTVCSVAGGASKGPALEGGDATLVPASSLGKHCCSRQGPGGRETEVRAA